MSASHLGSPASLIDLNGPGHYLSVGWLSISWANATVILLMLVTFALALLIPFPGEKR